MKAYKMGVMAAIRVDLTQNVSLSRLVGASPMVTLAFPSVEAAKASMPHAIWKDPGFFADEDVVAFTEFSITVGGRGKEALCATCSGPLVTANEKADSQCAKCS